MSVGSAAAPASLFNIRGVGVNSNNGGDDERIRRLDRTNNELRAALAECREKLNRLEEVLKQTGQDNDRPGGGAA